MPRKSGYAQPSNWGALRKRVLDAADGCYLCDGPPVSVDHILAVASGGSHHPDNLAAICAPCKATKDEQDRLDGIARRRARIPITRKPEAHPGRRS